MSYQDHRSPAIAVLVLTMMSCVALGQNVQSSFLPGVNFSKYHTYGWAATRPHPDPNVDAEIKRSIDSQLKTKNLTLTDINPDLIVDYHVAISQEEKWPLFRYNDVSESARPVTVSAGTLGIDLCDPALNQMVWSCHVSKAVDPSNAAAKKQSNLDKAIRELLKGFPPRVH